MRKLLLLIASLLLVTAFGWARDFYNQVLLIQTEQCRLEKNTIGQPPVMLAGNNMITDGQQPGADLFNMQAAQPSRSDFYHAIVVVQVDGYKAENDANWAGPTLLAGKNMVTGGQVWSRGQDFYAGVLSANVGEFRSENGSIGAGPILLANMITGEQVFAPEAVPADFYNQVLSAKVDEYSIDNNAIAPSATEFAVSQSVTPLPGSMASNVGVRSGDDWYGRTIATQAELNRRIKKAGVQN